MEKQRGIWLDHQKAMIIDPDNKSEITTIYSEVNGEYNRLNKSRLNGQSISPERKLEAKRKRVLRTYYSNIIDSLDEESELFIFGPAEAKNEFKKELEGNYKRFTAVTVSTSDSMTNNQLVAHVKGFFNDN